MDHVSPAGLEVPRLEQVEVQPLTAVRSEYALWTRDPRPAPPAGDRYADMSSVGR
jgi:hypothetical protein